MKRLIFLLMMVLLFTNAFGLTFSHSSGQTRKAKQLNGSTLISEQVMTEENQERLLLARPPVEMQDSLERKQINMRTNLWNNPSKVAYVYLYSYGRCLGFHVIKGKVSSVNSMVTNPEQVKEVDTNYGENQVVVVASPSEDGSYGTNGDGIFFFTTSGVYVETSVDYILVDQPMKIEAVQLN